MNRRPTALELTSVRDSSLIGTQIAHNYEFCKLAASSLLDRATITYAPKKRPTKRAFAERIRSAVLALEDWRTETMGTSHVLMTALEILRTTRAAKLEDMPAAGTDIWTPKCKGPSIWWNDEHELEVVAFKKGDWHAPLLAPTLPEV